MDDEIVDVVDDDDRVVGQVSRSEMRSRGLLHRVASTIVLRSDGRVLVHRRTETKDVFPGAFDCFVGGVVASGETYEQARDRELAEEMGIAGVTPVELFRHRYESEDDRSISAVSWATWDGPVVPQPEEIAWFAWEPVEDVARRVEEPTFVPDGREVFRRWRSEGSPGLRGRVAS
jgi:isopentenyldiphosphate isomerase